MKVLVATSETQGQRDNDFCFVPEGELLHFGFECDQETIDGTCGCRRSMSGLDCSKATTTIKVIESDITSEDLSKKITDFYINAWKMEENKAKELAKEEVKDLLRIVNSLEVGAILEKRGTKFQERKVQ
jgi:hypothetical protein